jgi:acyl-CoA reductase-like NAD-dependent aldehyde dehydrogenase
MEPTILDRVGRDMSVAQDEIFGPVLVVIPFDSLEVGLVAAIWTRDIDKAMSLASRVRAGQVYINGYRAGAGVELPFGGYKKSGYGREKGLESLRSYTQVKNVCIKFA